MRAEASGCFGCFWAGFLICAAHFGWRSALAGGMECVGYNRVAFFFSSQSLHHPFAVVNFSLCLCFLWVSSIVLPPTTEWLLTRGLSYGCPFEDGEPSPLLLVPYPAVIWFLLCTVSILHVWSLYVCTFPPSQKQWCYFTWRDFFLMVICE